MLNEKQAKMVAAVAGVDVRTVERALFSGGTSIRSSSTRVAIISALRELGFDRQATKLENATAPK